MTVEIEHLRPNHPMSRVIKGGWQLAGDHGSVDRNAAIKDMSAFLDAGITTFDCADIYEGVEEMIGEFIADTRRNQGTEAAEKISIHTKLVPDLSMLESVTDGDIEAIVDRSLKRLQIEQLHLVQFYWWDLTAGDPIGSLTCLKRLQEKGKIRSLGVNNWDAKQISKFTDADFDVISAQVQYSVLDRRPAGNNGHGLSDWAAQHDMKLLCYGTLAGGFLTSKWLGVPDPGFKFENRSLVKYRLIIEEFGGWELFQQLLSSLRETGDKHGVSLSAVASRFVLDQPQVAGTIIGARYSRHLPETLQIFQFSFDEEDRARLNMVLDQSPGPRGPVYGLEGDRNSIHGRIMKYNLNTEPDAPIFAETGGS